MPGCALSPTARNTCALTAITPVMIGVSRSWHSAIGVYAQLVTAFGLAVVKRQIRARHQLSQ